MSKASSRLRRLTRGKGLRVYTAAVYAFLFAPIVVLVLFSFNNAKRSAHWAGFTTKWYGELLHDQAILDALSNTMKVAAVATLTATIFGTLGAFALTRYKFRGSDLYNGAIYIPLVIPEIVFGVALLTFFVAIGMPLSLTTVMIAHIAFSISFVIIIVKARMADFDGSLEEAAMDLGATEVETFIYVTLPFMLPGIVAGALMAFILSFDDFVITFFTAGVGATTLPLKVFSMVKFGVSPEINVISVFMLLMAVLLLIVFQRVQRVPGTVKIKSTAEAEDQ